MIFASLLLCLCVWLVMDSTVKQSIITTALCKYNNIYICIPNLSILYTGSTTLKIYTWYVILASFVCLKSSLLSSKSRDQREARTVGVAPWIWALPPACTSPVGAWHCPRQVRRGGHGHLVRTLNPPAQLLSCSKVTLNFNLYVLILNILNNFSEFGYTWWSSDTRPTPLGIIC